MKTGFKRSNGEMHQQSENNNSTLRSLEKGLKTRKVLTEKDQKVYAKNKYSATNHSMKVATTYDE